MLESQNPERLDPNQIRDAMLSNIHLAEGFEKDDFIYDETVRGLIIPGTDQESLRLAFFRAVNIRTDDIANRPYNSANTANTQFGKGLYGGNSVESVAHFAWRSNRTVKMFLTPEISRNEVLDESYADDERMREIKDLIRIKIGTVHNKTGHVNQQHLSEKYGDSKLIVMNKPLDVRLSQWLQSGSQSYPVKPYWYLWRGDSNEGFQDVGEATQFPKQRRLAKVAVQALMGIPKT